MFFLGGHTIVAAGWAGPRAVFVDFVSQYSTGWHWQLYAGRTLIGVTPASSARRIIGQLVVDTAPAALTLIRVDAANRTTDYGALLPAVPWHRYRIRWSVSSFPADTSHFDVLAGPAAGEPVDAEPVARVPFRGDGDYSHVPAPFPTAGDWSFQIVPRDNARPMGNAGTPTDIVISAALPPADLAFDGNGNRFSLTVDAGDLVAAFTYPE